jgi:redox-sensitive bicupin YhaK (pirin superfamily)
MKIRRSAERGHSKYQWLESKHSFSFGNYIDPHWMGFGALRVINDDTVDGGMGFDPHSHRDMEIISYITHGALRHQDSMGHSSVVEEGSLQRMSAGNGVIHSEYNADRADPVKFFQIWIEPNVLGVEPEYEELLLEDAPLKDGWRLVASGDPAEGAMTIHQDARFLIGQIPAQRELTYDLAPGRRLWAHVSQGPVQVNATTLEPGDAAIIEEAGPHRFDADAKAEVLLFEVA